MDGVTQVEARAVEPSPPGPWTPWRLLAGPNALKRWAVASLVVNVVIVVTGGLVRLTASGLGCPTWPRCTSDSYTTHPALGIHGAIEFGNRLLTFVVVIVALLTWVAALLHRDPHRADVRGGRRRNLRWLAGGMLLGIPAQAVIGGISVLTHLNPWVVGLHFVVSMVLIGLSVGLVRATWRAQPTLVVRPLPVTLARTTFAAMVVLVWLGTAVTGSGPHSGDAHVVNRNGVDGLLVTHLHASLAYLTIALVIGCRALIRTRATLWLIAVLVLQAAIGLSQYYLGLPIGLVALHLLGACLTVATATNLLLSVRRGPIPRLSRGSR